MKRNKNIGFELQCKDASKPETVAELQARKLTLEADIKKFEAKDDALSKAELRAARAELSEVEKSIELDAANAKLSETDKVDKERRKTEATFAIECMKKSGAIAPRDTKREQDLMDKFQADPSLIPIVAGAAIEAARGNKPANGANLPRQGSTTPPSAEHSIQQGFSVQGAIKKYYELVSANAAVNWKGDLSEKITSYRKKGDLALEAGAFFKTQLAPHISEWEHVRTQDLGKMVGLEAADYNDPNNNLGVLSGTLVLQRTLPNFAYKYPELMSMYTDFSDAPGLYQQTENTRIVVQPPVEKYDATLDASGRPKGWDTISTAVTTNVSLTLTDYIAVPIVFGNNILGATTRRLFDEQAVLAIKAIAGYFVGMVTNLVTSGNYNAYAVAGTNGIPAAGPAYATYARGLQELAMSDLDALDAIFTNGKVPEEDRGIWLTPSYYSKLRSDPRLSFYYAASAKNTDGTQSDFMTEARLPKLSGFAPYKAPYLPASTPATNPTTNNVVGFAYQKAGVILKSRLPQDFTQALGVMIPGSVTTVTDPDTKISLMLVQYVHLTQGYAEWRPEVMLGTAVGDNRAGLVLTSV